MFFSRGMEGRLGRKRNRRKKMSAGQWRREMTGRDEAIKKDDRDCGKGLEKRVIKE